MGGIHRTGGRDGDRGGGKLDRKEEIQKKDDARKKKVSWKGVEMLRGEEEENFIPKKEERRGGEKKWGKYATEGFSWKGNRPRVTGITRPWNAQTRQGIIGNDGVKQG